MGETLSSQPVSTRLQRIAEQAKTRPELVFTTLAHLIDVELLREAYQRTRKDSSPGVDGVTAKEYGVNLAANLSKLHERLRTQQYYAPPVKRVYLEKEDGSKRPIGMPAFESKVVERAVAMLLGAVYEQDFYECSYGFRPGRSPHQALTQLRNQCAWGNINWVVDADVSGCFDNIPKGQLLTVIRQRVNDGGILRLIGKWLNAGVLDGEELFYPEKGTPQGSVISPLLANIYLHEVLDKWFEQDAKPRLKGQCFLLRFADDFVIGCELESDARRLMAVLPKRFGRYGLTIHATKTKLVKFGRPKLNDDGQGNGTFDFLGFTHYWTRGRKGTWVVKRKTAAKRLRRAGKRVWQWCQHHRHAPLREQHKILSSKLRGHYQYYGIRSNYASLRVYYEYVQWAWRSWLHRRGGKKRMTVKRFAQLVAVFSLPPPRIIHSI
jgi:group II intron reverse transcriptase/maturase